MAEKIRQLDEFAPASFARFLELTRIQDELKILPAMKMVKTLFADHETMIEVLNEAFSAAENEKQQGVMDFLAERISQHKNHRWQLKATADV